MMTASTSQATPDDVQDLSMDNLDRAETSDRDHLVNSMSNAASPRFSDSEPFAKSIDASQAATSPHHQFSMDNFDFGADFGLPTTLDEMNLFHQHQQQNQVTHHQQQQQQGQPQQRIRDQNHKRAGSSGSRSLGGPPSSDGIANSPHNISFSPSSSIRDHQRLQSGKISRTQSPHPLSIGATSDHGSVTGPPISNVELQNLLMAVQASASVASPPSQQSSVPLLPSNSSDGSHHGTMSTVSTLGQMSISDLEKYLAEKEQNEKMQIMQTALLRQQLESLQKQHSQSSADRPDDQRLRNFTAAQLMQQYKQMNPQYDASTPTQQHPRIPSFSSQNQGYTDSMNLAALAVNTQIPSHKGNGSSALTQYGLATPMSSGAFVHQGAPPFVSPIHMPPGTHAAFIEHQRAYDAITNGTFTPLESPAVTPASVFSNMGGSHSTATTSQDFFSPLTSPALRPQVGQPHDELMLPPASPFHGPMVTRGRGRNGSKGSPHFGPSGKRTTTPSASPITAPIKSIPRKNRSTTAEARANRARPSPLVKPTAAGNGSVAITTRKRADSSATSGMPSPLGTTYTNGNNLVRNISSTSSDGRKGVVASSTTFPPISASTMVTKSMCASPSEGAASTPSPIDLNTSANFSNTSKPMTPGSVMGIHATRRSKAKSIDNGTKQVSFAGQSQADEQQEASLDDASKNVLAQTVEGPSGDPWISASNRSSGGIESRRTSHKAAEQKRRDSLKYCFDELRGMLPAITLDDDVPGGSSLGPDGFLEDQDEEGFSIEEVGDAESAALANRAISKVALLRHSNEYLIRLKGRLTRRDRDLEYCRRQVMELRSRLGYPIESQMGGVMTDFTTIHNDTMHQNSTFVPMATNHMDVS